MEHTLPLKFYVN